MYLIKNAPIIRRTSTTSHRWWTKYVVKSNDVLKVVSDTASSCDVIISVVCNLGVINALYRGHSIKQVITPTTESKFEELEEYH